MRNMDMKKFIIFLLLLSSSTLFAQKNNASKDTTTTFEVSGSCEMCKMRIEEATKGKGVKSAVWDVDTKILTLVFNPTITTSYKVHDRIADAGHDTRLIKAAGTTYNGLPDCCRYRDGDIAYADKLSRSSPNILHTTSCRAPDINSLKRICTGN